MKLRVGRVAYREGDGWVYRRRLTLDRRGRRPIVLARWRASRRAWRRNLRA